MSAAAPLQNLAAKPQPLSNSTHAGLLLQRKCACGSATSSVTGECAECKSKKRLQTKLAIGASNDPLEREADRVADQVLAAPANPAVSGAPPHIQRYAGQPSAPTSTAPASVDRVLANSGRPLEPALRRDMEQRFGHDFSRVRVHSGAAADKSAREANAHAYTVGHNIVFGVGRLVPETHEGRRLIAHELAHVVQQQSGAGMTPSPTAANQPKNPPVREVEQTSRRVIAPDPINLRTQSTAKLQRSLVDVAFSDGGGASTEPATEESTQDSVLQADLENVYFALAEIMTHYETKETGWVESFRQEVCK